MIDFFQKNICKNGKGVVILQRIYEEIHKSEVKLKIKIMKNFSFKFEQGKLTVDADIFDTPIAIESCNYFYNTNEIIDRIWNYLYHSRAIKTEFINLFFEDIRVCERNRISYCEGSFISNL